MAQSILAPMSEQDYIDSYLLGQQQLQANMPFPDIEGRQPVQIDTGYTVPDFAFNYLLSPFVPADMAEGGGDYEFAVPDAAKGLLNYISQTGAGVRGEAPPLPPEEQLLGMMDFGGAGLLLSRPDAQQAAEAGQTMLGVFAGQKAKNFPAYKDIDQTKLEQLKVKYETAPDMDSKKAAIKEYEKELKSVKSQKQEKIEEATGILDKPSYSSSVGFSDTERKYGTGLFRLPDGGLRFEIDDSNAKVVFPDFDGDIVAPVDKNRGSGFNNFDPEFSKLFLKEYNLDEVFKHPELYENYPDFRNIKVQFTNDPKSGGGSFNPNLNLLKVNLSSFKNEGTDAGLSKELLSDRVADIIVHEVQHSIQDTEDFARGGNYALAQMVGEQEKQIAKRNLEDTAFSENIYNNKRQDLFNVSDAKAIQRYQEMSRRESFQPRQIRNTSDWYKYGDRIRRELADELGYNEPKTKSPKRDLWHKAAFAKMALYAREDNPVASKLADELTEKQLGKRSKEISKELDPLRSDVMKNKAARGLMDEFYPAGSFYNFEDNIQSRHNIYENLLGEAEARAVQARRGQTLAGHGGLLMDKPLYLEYPKQSFPLNQFEKGSMRNPPPLGLSGTFVRRRY